MERTFQLGTSFLIVVLAAGSQAIGRSEDPDVSSKVTVDRVLARVEDRLITFSDLFWQIRWRNFPVPADPEERRRLLREILDQLIAQELILREVERAPFIVVNQAEEEAFLQRFRSRFQDEEAYEAFLSEAGMREVDLHRLIRRQLIVNKFIQMRFEPFVVVLPEEVERYYQETLRPELETQGLTAPPLELVRDTIREILTVQGTSRQLEDWLAQSRRRVEVEVQEFPE